MYILGINAYHGDSSACIMHNDEIIAASEEERFRRIKHWAGFPTEAIKFCLGEAGIDITQVDYLIEEIFSKSYNLSFSKAPESYLNRNKSSKINTLQFNQLPPKLQQKFLDRTRWDKKLYNRLTQ